MKRFVSVLLLTLLFSPVFADETAQDENIITEPEQQEIMLNVNTQKKYNTEKRDFKSYKADTPQVSEKREITDYSTTNPNQKRSVTTKHKKKVKDVTFGSDTTHNFTSDTYSGSNTLYTEYEKKKFKINTGYTHTSTPNQETTDKGSISVTPEYKINKHVSVQNKFSNNMNDNSQKGEVRLNVKPLKDDRLDMGVGVGQKFSGKNAPSSSQVNFSTNFKF